VGRSHHALDDAGALAGVLRHLGELKLARARRSALAHLLGWLGLALALDAPAEPTAEERLLRQANDYALREPVSRWLGADTANHYQWYPWINYGHYELWRQVEDVRRTVMTDNYRRGLAAVAARADNGFLAGIPFIGCSNDLMTAFATYGRRYRRMSGGDTTYLRFELAAVDWLFGANPWGTSMVIGLPADGDFPTDPHSVVAKQLGVQTQKGGLVDGPVYRSIFQNLMYIELTQPDEYARWNTGSIVYHDDWGDYSTNEPIMDGTASLVYILAALGDVGWQPE